MTRSVGIVSLLTGCSRLLGLVREQVMAYYFGAGMATDAFVTAFRIPNLLRDMFAEGALSSAFVPVFKDKLVRESKEEALALANRVISAMLIVVGGVVVLGIIFSPVIVKLTAWGFSDEPGKFALTVALTQIMWIFLLLVSLAAVVMGILNSFGVFGIPAFSPAMFNVGSVATVLILYGVLDEPIYAMAIGVVVGGFGQLIVQLPALRKAGFHFKFVAKPLDAGVRRVTKLIWPMIIGLSAGRINILVATLVASFLAEGAISYLNYAFRLMHLPMGIFAVALGTVALPKIAELFSRGDKGELQNTFAEAFNLNLLLVAPSAIFFLISGEKVLRVIYGHGAFSLEDVANTQRALWHYSYGLLGFSAVRVVAPFFYAAGDSRRPMFYSLVAVAANLILYYPLVKMFDYAGLAAAASIGGMMNSALLLSSLSECGLEVRWMELAKTTAKIVIGATLSLFTADWIAEQFFSDNSLFGQIAQLFVIMGLSGLFYWLACMALRIEEVHRITAKVRGLISRRSNR
jgi:putative peptidoglycan lipid II flippase